MLFLMYNSHVARFEAVKGKDDEVILVLLRFP